MNKPLALAVLGVAAWWFWPRRSLTPSVTTSETFTLGASAAVRRVARAIAQQEGFYVTNSIPQRANNPGDLVLGPPSIGEGITVFASPDDGWNALYRQLNLIVAGASRYTLDTTIAEMGNTWSGGDGAWAMNVARLLGVPQTTPLYAVLV